MSKNGVATGALNSSEQEARSHMTSFRKTGRVELSTRQRIVVYWCRHRAYGTSRAGIRQGGESGSTVVLGDVGKSLVLDALRYESVEIPPEAKLPDAVIADFSGQPIGNHHEETVQDGLSSRVAN